MLRCILSALGACLLLVAHVVAAPPVVTRVVPWGLTSGQTNKIVVEGANLSADLQCLGSVPLAAQKVVGQPAPNRVEMELTLPADATPGLPAWRFANPSGISPAIVIPVDKLATLPFAEQLPSLPIAVSGTLSGQQVLRTSFAGKQGQPVWIDVEAQRLGGNLRPTVRLYDPRGAQLAWSPPRFQFGGDARCQATLPADGAYAIELHDHLYKGAEPSHFRLKVGEFQFAERTLPLAVQTGKQANLKLLLSNISAPVTWQAGDIAGDTTLPWPSAPLPTGAAPRLQMTSLPEFATEIPAEAAAPAGFSDVLPDNGDERQPTLAVSPGQKLRFAVFARDLGSPLDAVLTIRNEQGNQLATADDRPGSSDPRLDFTIPANVNKIKVGVKDLHGRGGADYFYRWEATLADAAEVDVAIAAEAIQLPVGNSVVLPVTLTRQNYAGAIALEPQGLPPQITTSGATIPPGATMALVALTAAPDANFRGTFGLLARFGEGPAAQTRRVSFAPSAATKYQPHLRYDGGLATIPAGPIQLAWSAPLSGPLVAGTTWATNVTLRRQNGVAGNVRLTLLTTQPAPKKKIKVNNQDQEVADPPRTIRLATPVEFTGDAKESAAAIVIPGDLPTAAWDLALVAELLSADGKNVVASAASPVQRVQTVAPFVIELAGANTAEAKAGSGAAGSFAGKITRAAGFHETALVTLTGLPKEILPPVVAVAPEHNDFTLPLTFPFGTKAGELKNLKLIAATDIHAAGVARSNEVVVNINVVAGEKPPAEAPLEVFDEQPEFIAALTEGDGQASAEETEKFSGKIALKVNSKEKQRAHLPGLSVKIRENPGPGEYRYLRFAWKKQGGNSVLLQLHHDGKWGPGGSGRNGAKFRYYAGPQGEPLDGALQVDDKIPGQLTVVTRDLFADFGEFTLEGLGFSPVDGGYAVFDHIYLGRTVDALAK